jgi:microcystin-dependent protein
MDGEDMTVVSRVYEGGTYTDVDFCELFESITTDGYVIDYGSELVVTAETPNIMKADVGTGRAHIRGYWYENTALYPQTIAAADPTNPRIDRIILRLETAAPKQISAKVLTGTPSVAPVPPTLTQTSAIWEISLAQVYVAANASQITSGNITDERDTTYCGVAAMFSSRWSELLLSTTLSINGVKITGIATPTGDTDGINKAYFDANITGGKYGANKCEIALCACISIPAGWLECDGANLLRATYPDLFASFGTSFGSVDGTHFNLPNLKGKLPYGASSSIGATGGEKTHAVSIAELPAHTHTTITKPGVNINIVDSEGEGSASRTASHAVNTGSTGGGAAHQNLHPYSTMRYIVRAS